jgi:hypothetical protein
MEERNRELDHLAPRSDSRNVTLWYFFTIARRGAKKTGRNHLNLQQLRISITIFDTWRRGIASLITWRLRFSQGADVHASAIGVDTQGLSAGAQRGVEP